MWEHGVQASRWGLLLQQIAVVFRLLMKNWMDSILYVSLLSPFSLSTAGEIVRITKSWISSSNWPAIEMISPTFGACQQLLLPYWFDICLRVAQNEPRILSFTPPSNPFSVASSWWQFQEKLSDIGHGTVNHYWIRITEISRGRAVMRSGESIEHCGVAVASRQLEGRVERLVWCKQSGKYLFFRFGDKIIC